MKPRASVVAFGGSTGSDHLKQLNWLELSVIYMAILLLEGLFVPEFGPVQSFFLSSRSRY